MDQDPMASCLARSRALSLALVGMLAFGCATTAATKAPTTAVTPSPSVLACPVSYGAPLTELKTSEAILAKHGSSLDGYKREGGVWLTQAPVLINREFDFGMAMALEGGLGAGLAAAQRKQANAQVAGALKSVVVHAELTRALEEERRCGLHTFFLLWGADKQTLSLVSEVPGSTSHELTEGASLAAETWTAPGTLERELTELFAQHQRARAK